MSSLQQWNCCPEFIDIGSEEGSVRLVKRDDLYAVQGTISKEYLEDLTVQLTGDDISILRGTPSGELASDFELLPVYEASKDATPVVATRRIFLRMDENVTIESARRDIEALDLVVDEIPAHAPHCAWLEPKSGRVDEALSKIASLRALPLTAHAEPQLLRPRSWKSGT